MLQSGGMRSAQRIADIGEAARYAGGCGARADRGRRRFPAAAGVAGAAAASRRAGDADRAEQAVRFSAMLRRFLGDEWPIVVDVTSTPPAWAAAYGGAGRGPGPGWMGGPGMMRGPGGPGAGPRGHFVRGAGAPQGWRASSRFRDREPAAWDTATWPYRLLLSLGVLLGGRDRADAHRGALGDAAAQEPLAEAAENSGADIDQPAASRTGSARSEPGGGTRSTPCSSGLPPSSTIARASSPPMSHDLKTPITRLRLRAELLDRCATAARSSLAISKRWRPW